MLVASPPQRRVGLRRKSRLIPTTRATTRVNSYARHLTKTVKPHTLLQRVNLNKFPLHLFESAENASLPICRPPSESPTNWLPTSESPDRLTQSESTERVTKSRSHVDINARRITASARGKRCGLPRRNYIRPVRN